MRIARAARNSRRAATRTPLGLALAAEGAQWWIFDGLFVVVG